MNTLYAAPITVLGIGNIILRDEGFGVRVVEYLCANYDFPSEVRLVDGGTLGIELTQYVVGTEKLLVIDSINGGAKPGTVFRFENEEIAAHFAEKISAHEIGIQDLLTMLDLTGKRVPHTVVIGAQPYDLGAGVELSAPMQELLPAVAQNALNELSQWGVSATKKSSGEDLNLNTVAEAKF